MKKDLLSLELSVLYPDEKFLVSWSHRYLSKFYKQGFKWCTTCNFLVKTIEKLCRKCRNAMRSKIRNKRKWVHKYTVSNDTPMIVDIKRGVII